MRPEGFKVQRPRVRGPGPLAVGLVWAKRATSPPARTFDVTEEEWVYDETVSRVCVNYSRIRWDFLYFSACPSVMTHVRNPLLIWLSFILLFLLLILRALPVNTIHLSLFCCCSPAVLSLCLDSHPKIFPHLLLLLLSSTSSFFPLLIVLTLSPYTIRNILCNFAATVVQFLPRIMTHILILLMWLSSTSSCPFSHYSRSSLSLSPRSSFMLPLIFFFSVYRLLYLVKRHSSLNLTSVRQLFSFPEFIFHRTWKFHFE